MNASDFPPASGPSLVARLLFTIAPFLAPNFSGPGVLQVAISKDRSKGPALPSGKILKRLTVTEESLSEDRIFRASAKSGSQSPIRLLYIHGGAFIFDLQGVQWTLVASLIVKTGAEVLIPIYPLAPEHDWRAGLASVKQAYLRLAAECGAQNVILVGDSAGGGLVLALAQSLRDDGAPLPAGLVMFSPWLDMSVSAEDQPEIERSDPALKIDFLREAGKMWAGASDLRAPGPSPLYGDLAGLPPALLFSGTRDILDSDAKRLAARGSDIIVRTYPGMVHVWPIAPIREGKQALGEAAAFIRHCVHGSAAPDGRVATR